MDVIDLTFVELIISLRSVNCLYMKTFCLYILVVILMTACDSKPKLQSTDYPRPCTEEDVSGSVRDKYFNQVENFLSNFYLLSLEVVDRDMAEDFVANLLGLKDDDMAEITK